MAKRRLHDTKSELTDTSTTNSSTRSTRPKLAAVCEGTRVEVGELTGDGAARFEGRVLAAAVWAKALKPEDVRQLAAEAVGTATRL